MTTDELIKALREPRANSGFPGECFGCADEERALAAERLEALERIAVAARHQNSVWYSPLVTKALKALEDRS